MSDPTPGYSPEQLASDDVSKKDLVAALQKDASTQFLLDHKLKGAVKNVVKTKTKDQLVEHYNELFESKSFKKEGDEEEAQAAAAKKKDVEKVTEKTKKMEIKDEGPPKYNKRIIKKGDKTTFPGRGDTVNVYYTGKLENGTVFDSNVIGGKKEGKRLLKFKVGHGHVIKGWDQGLMTMSIGEKAELTIEPEWAYGKKGVEGKIPPNSRLIFEVELVSME